MGLDMYLYAQDTTEPETEAFEIAYWRKANAIHNYFVEVAQGGIDDCNEYEVSLGQLRALVHDCKMLLTKDETLDPEAILPTVQGFFFGTYEYDDWYYGYLQETVDMLTPILEDEDVEDFKFYYSSSW